RIDEPGQTPGGAAFPAGSVAHGIGTASRYRSRVHHQEWCMVEIADLAKLYGSVVALDGASFTAQPGRIVGFLGPNGAGKTTTMRCIFGLCEQTRGEVRWTGQPVERDTRLRFGYMPEQRGLYPRMRVLEQVSYFAQQHGLSSREADAAGR